MKQITIQKNFILECGAVLPEVTIAYHTYGTLSPSGDNVTWVCHALTANSDVADWWPDTVCEGRFLDPSKNFVICANMLGSHYGTTSPLSMNYTTGEPYYGDFPLITVRDIVRCNMLLAESLGIGSINVLIGSSIGGFQCLEWAIMQPDFVKHMILIATCAKSQPWAIALNESQRMAIECDPTFGEKRMDAGARGLATARSIALLSYRGQNAYDMTQQETDGVERLKSYRAASYQRHQGEKLRQRFNVYSYYTFTRAVDSHDVGRGRGGCRTALAQVKAKTLVVAITSDILYPPSDHKIIYETIPDSTFELITSNFGHDGFLLEGDKLNKIIFEFLE